MIRSIIVATALFMSSLAFGGNGDEHLPWFLQGERDYRTESPNQFDQEMNEVMGLAIITLFMKVFDTAVNEINHYQETRPIDKVEVIRSENEECDVFGSCVTTVTIKTTSHKREKGFVRN